MKWLFEEPKSLLEQNRNKASCMSANDGRAIANYILDRCDASGRTVHKTSLLKIIYFCHVWSLIELGRPLIKQQFEAWEYGPVLQYVYRQFKGSENQAINSRAKKFDPNLGQEVAINYEFDEQTKNLLDRVVDFYSRLSASQLVELSHIEDGPWHKVWNHQSRINPGMKIDDNEIREFYSKAIPPYSIQ